MAARSTNGSRGTWGPGSPPSLPPRFFSKSCSFQAILWENPYFEQILGSGAPWGVKTLLAPLTKILDPSLHSRLDGSGFWCISIKEGHLRQSFCIELMGVKTWRLPHWTLLRFAVTGFVFESIWEGGCWLVFFVQPVWCSNANIWRLPLGIPPEICSHLPWPWPFRLSPLSPVVAYTSACIFFWCRVLKGAGSQSVVSVWQHTLVGQGAGSQSVVSVWQHTLGGQGAGGQSVVSVWQHTLGGQGAGSQSVVSVWQHTLGGQRQQDFL